MNRIFGAAGTAGAIDRYERLLGHLSGAATGESKSLSAGARSRLGVTDDAGAVLRIAAHGPISLVLFGRFERTGRDQPASGSAATPDWLLQRFLSRGDAFLDGLHGHYAVAVADADSGALWLAMDPAGQRRIFVRTDAQGLCFSTQLADFADLLGSELQLDRGLEEFLLAHEFLPDRRTPYAGVQVLPPGVVARWDGSTLQQRAIDPGPIWEDWLGGYSLDRAGSEETVDAVGRAFQRALEEQLPDDERCAVLLGGFDSALIAASLTRMGKKVETFSFHFEDDSYNQPYVEELAELLGIEHHWVPITPSVIGNRLERYSDVFNQPVCQPHYVIATEEVCHAIRRRGIAHAFSGDGCDGLFLGYPTVHMRAVFIQSLSRVSPVLLPLLGPLSRSARLERRLGHPYRVARNVLRVLRRPMPIRGHIASCILDRESLEQLSLDPLPPQEREPEEILASLATGLDDVSPIRLAYKGKGAVGLNKTKLEGSTASSGITICSPFLHPGMRRMAAMLPEEMLRPKEQTKSEATGKYALMRMAEEQQMLPEAMIYQAKRSPVTAPVDHWYMGPLKESVLEQLETGLPFRCDDRALRALLEPKLAESWFRRYVGISRYAMHAPALLASYASFTAKAVRR
jgi:asparagine synthase (glutamine-hydrolysing)